MPKSENSGIQSVDRALRILAAIADSPGEKTTLDTLSSLLEIDRSSVFRLLSTLMAHGLVRQDESRKSYRLGFGIFALAGALRNQLKITELASPHLKRLAELTAENAHLAVRAGTRAVFVDRERAAKTIAANTNIGDSEELYCTAVGRCLLAGLTEAELAKFLGSVELTKFTDYTTVDPELLIPEIQKVKKLGFAVDREEYERGVICVAAPIFNFEGAVEASIGISGPKDRIDAKIDAFAEEVRAAGAAIGAVLGYRQ